MNSYREKALSRAFDQRRRNEEKSALAEQRRQDREKRLQLAETEATAAFADLMVRAPVDAHLLHGPIRVERDRGAIRLLAGPVDQSLTRIGSLTIESASGSDDVLYRWWAVNPQGRRHSFPTLSEALDWLADEVGTLLDPNQIRTGTPVVLTPEQWRLTIRVLEYAIGNGSRPHDLSNTREIIPRIRKAVDLPIDGDS